MAQRCGSGLLLLVFEASFCNQSAVKGRFFAGRRLHVCGRFDFKASDACNGAHCQENSQKEAGFTEAFWQEGVVYFGNSSSNKK